MAQVGTAGWPRRTETTKTNPLTQTQTLVVLLAKLLGRFYDLDDIPRWQHANLPWDSITKDLARTEPKGVTLSMTNDVLVATSHTHNRKSIFLRRFFAICAAQLIFHPATANNNKKLP